MKWPFVFRPFRQGTFHPAHANEKTTFACREYDEKRRNLFPRNRIAAPKIAEILSSLSRAKLETTNCMRATFEIPFH
jgi:hypothetical protein